MRYRYLDDFRRGISVFAIFSYGIAVLGTPQCPPQFSSIECFDKNLADQKTCIIMNNNHFYHWVFMREQNNQKHF